MHSQIQLCRHFCDSKEKIEEFVDVGYSGGNMKRPQLQRMMQQIEQGLVCTVMVYRLDRISRSIADFSKLMEMFTHKNVRFISCTEWFDTSTPMGRAMLSIAATFAQLERETISQRVADVYQSRSLLGEYMGGQLPLGYKLDSLKHSYIPEDTEMRLVKYLFELYSRTNMSYQTVAERLNQEGYRTRRGNLFSQARIGEIIRNPCYVKSNDEVISFIKKNLGHKVFPLSYKGDGNGFYCYQIRMKQQIYVMAPHTGIIEAQLWIEVQKKRTLRFGEALRITQDTLDSKNYYAYNPEFDK